MAAFRAALIALVGATLVGGCLFPGSVRPSVKIGLVAPFEGLYRPVGYDALYAVKLAVREANARGGAGGYLIELVALDDGNLPRQAELAARKVSLDPDVVAVIGHFSDAATRAALPVYRERGLPLVVTASQAAEGELVFQLYPDEGEIAEAIADCVCTRSGRIVLLGQEDEGSAAILRERCGSDRVDVAPPGEFLDWGGYDVLVWLGGAVEGAEVLSWAVEGGFGGEFVGGPEACSPLFVAFAGEEARRAYCIAVNPASLPPDFALSYRELAGGDPGSYAPLAYEAAELVIAAVREAASKGQVTREAVVSALEDVFAGHSEALMCKSVAPRR